MSNETPPGTPPATPPTENPPATPPAANWMDGLTDELKGVVQLKGFQNVSNVVESYRNLEKMIGVPPDRVLKLPDKVDAPEWNDIYYKLGTPKEAKEYGDLALPNGAKKEEHEDFYKGLFHKARLTKDQAAMIMKEVADRENKKQSEALDNFNQAKQADVDGLKKKWGLAHDQNVDLAKRAAGAFGITGEQIDQLEQVMGYSKVMEFMHTLGTKVGEDQFVRGGNNRPGIFTPEMAKAKLAELKSDKDFQTRMMSGDIGAKNQFTELIRMANPDLS